MANNIIIPSKVDSCRETKIFGAISPNIFQAILDSIPVICRAVLNWEPLANWFLAEIIRQIPLSGEIVHLGHSEFGRILFGEESSEIAIRQRMGRAIKSVKRCQLLSGFKAVDIRSGDVIEDHGKKEYFPTSYQLCDFFSVFLEFRDLAKEQNMMALPQRKRKITQFAIAKSICDARGYVAIPKIIRERKEKKEKSANGAEAESAHPAEDRIDKQDVQSWLDRIEEDQFDCGQIMLNGGQKLSTVDSKLNARCVAARLRLKAAVSRKDGRADFAPDTALRIRARLALESAAEQIKEARRALEEMGKPSHAEKMSEAARAVEQMASWKVFRSRERV